MNNERVIRALMNQSVKMRAPELRREALLNRDDLKEVEIASCCTILGVEDAEERVTFDVSIFTRYQDPTVCQPDENAPDFYQSVSAYDGFVPFILIEDWESARDFEFKHSVSINYRTGLIWTTFFNTVTVSQNMDFRRFPFDIQLFCVTFLSTNCKWTIWKGDEKILGFPKIEGLPDNSAPPKFLFFGAPGNWQINQMNIYYKPQPRGSEQLNGSYVQLEMVAKRRPLYYFINYYIVVYLIVVTNVCVLAIKPSEAGDRNSLTLTLLLTLTAFKYVITQGVTKVSYLTFMDYYVLTSFFYILAGIVENILVATQGRDFINGNDDENAVDSVAVVRTDFIFHMVFFSSWTFLHLFLLVVFLKPGWIRPTWEQVYDNTTTTERRNIVKGDIFQTPDENEDEAPPPGVSVEPAGLNGKENL